MFCDMKDGAVAHMSRAQMIRRTVQLVTELRVLVEMCSEFYTRGRTRTGSIRIPPHVVDPVLVRTREFRRMLESIATTFWEDGGQPNIERKVNTVVTAQGYQDLRVVLKQFADMGDYWNHIEQTIVIYMFRQGHTYFRVLGLYMGVIRMKLHAILRSVDVVMYMDVQRRDVTGPRSRRPRMHELHWQNRLDLLESSTTAAPFSRLQTLLPRSRAHVI